nr:MAG TPA: hypothetical protein [Caudoviricetes sp.]
MERDVKTKIFNSMSEYLAWRDRMWKEKRFIEEVSLDIQNGRVLVGYIGEEE